MLLYLSDSKLTPRWLYAGLLDQMGMKPRNWKGEVNVLSMVEPYEMEINARGSYFHLIIGQHAYGNYMCLPNWNIGSEMAGMTDNSWN